MTDYVVTPSKRLGLPEETITAKSPKEAVVEYAKRHGLAYNTILKITNKVLKTYNVNYTNLDNFVDFAVTGNIALNAGGMYKLIV